MAIKYKVVYVPGLYHVVYERYPGGDLVSVADAFTFSLAQSEAIALSYRSEALERASLAIAKQDTQRHLSLRPIPSAFYQEN